MGTLTLRLPEKLDARLSKLAKLEDTSRSELARTALEKFLREMEREKLMAEMVEAARFLATNPEARAKSIAIAEEFAVADSEALDISEGRKPGDPQPKKWWK
jgi:predicted transcriptional regulator